LLEKGYNLSFEHKTCAIKDTNNLEVFKVYIKEKSFSLDLMKEEQEDNEDDNTNKKQRRSSMRKTLKTKVSRK